MVVAPASAHKPCLSGALKTLRLTAAVGLGYVGHSAYWGGLYSACAWLLWYEPAFVPLERYNTATKSVRVQNLSVLTQKHKPARVALGLLLVWHQQGLAELHLRPLDPSVQLCVNAACSWRALHQQLLSFSAHVPCTGGRVWR